MKMRFKADWKRFNGWMALTRRAFQITALLLSVWISLEWAGVLPRPATAVSPQLPEVESLLSVAAPPSIDFTLDRIVSPQGVQRAPLSSASEGEGPVVILRGIMLGAPPKAYVEEKASGQLLTVTEGDRIGPITIKAIEAARVLIERDGKSYELRL